MKLITFNQALLLLAGIPLNKNKLDDEKSTIIYKPNKEKTKFIRKLKEDGYTDLANIELKLYCDLIEGYDILVSAYSDSTPSEPTISSYEFKKWAKKKRFSRFL